MFKAVQYITYYIFPVLHILYHIYMFGFMENKRITNIYFLSASLSLDRETYDLQSVSYLEEARFDSSVTLLREASRQRPRMP